MKQLLQGSRIGKRQHIYCRSLMAWMLLWSMVTSAVQINPEGEGEVLIYPYYTVNNNLNTAYSLVNTTARPKVVKVSFREGQAGLMMLSFNVYLAAYDVWTGALGPTVSFLPGHNGEPSVIHVSGDSSCVPRVDKTGEKFVPSALDGDRVASNKSLERARTGYFEALELGELTGEAAAHISHNQSGIPNNCNAIGASWNTGSWQFDALNPPTGGLIGSAFIVNVAEGVSVSYDAIALQNFWEQDGQHTEPGSALPDLSSGTTQSRVLLTDGTLAVSDWGTGYEAVSALFMNTEVINEYALDTIVNGQTEWLLSFPTKHHHVVTNSGQPKPPFTHRWNGLTSCDEYTLDMFDREAQQETVSTGGVGIRPPAPPNPQLCLVTNVLSFILPGSAAQAGSSRLLGADPFYTLITPSIAHATENGWARLDFMESNLMIPESGMGFRGLPVTGFAMHQYTNGGAGEGLLAQYGSLFMHKGRVDAIATQN
ncbi:hypothetical protein ACFODZ_09840 [Marinicella sediminis]|uniref:Uncharacterized protein n=1 Tax=Marinicella sediminis TaxID=1792834 RepID=A0ABV7JBL1_9GAMM|nr:hypothetical protein [Marinicella sediminis]